MTDDRSTFLAALGQRIRALREARGLSRDDLAVGMARAEQRRGGIVADFGRAVQTLREQRGMSRDDLAAEAETTVERLEVVEEGREDPKYLLALRIARALDTTLGALTGGTPE